MKTNLKIIFKVIFLKMTNWSRIITLFLLCNAFTVAGLDAQGLKVVSDVTAELTKTSRSGIYGGTFILGNHAKVIYVSSTNDEGAQVEEYDFSLNGGGPVIEDRFISSDSAFKTLPWYMPKSQVEKIADTNGKWLKATRAFGSGMKLWRGSIKKHYVLGVYTGMEFLEEEAIKPKTGDIWRITPGGYKSLSDFDALATSNGFYNDLDKYGNPLLMPANSTLLAAGVITEKVSLKSDQKYASNRVAVLTMNGMNFEDMQYETYLLPYTASTITSGLGQDDNLCSLFAPLNGPTTLKSLKHLYWKENKEHFTVMRFNDQRKLVDSASFQSKLMWGDYQILNGNGSSFVLGKGDAKNGHKFGGWYKGYVYKKVTGIQVVKIKDGNSVYTKLFTEEDLVNKIVDAGGKKVKFGMYVPRNNFSEVVNLPNGDDLIIGYTPLEFYALQLSSTGDLKAFYLIPLGKQDELNLLNYQYMLKNDHLILVANLQPVAFSTDAKVDVDVHRGAGIKITTTTVTKLNEVFMQSYVYRINTAQAKITDMKAFDGKEFYPMGSYPAMFTTDAIYFTGREKGPKGKVIHVVKVEL